MTFVVLCCRSQKLQLSLRLKFNLDVYSISFIFFNQFTKLRTRNLSLLSYFYALDIRNFLLQTTRFNFGLNRLFIYLLQSLHLKKNPYLRFRIKNKRFNIRFLDFFFFKFFTIKLYLIRFRYELGSLFSYRLLKLHYLFFF